MEQWKDIVGYEGLYQVSDEGRIRNRHGKLLNPRNRRDPYLRIRLSKDNKNSLYFLHRLVLATFQPIDSTDLEVDHIDHNPKNNKLVNLRWVTSKTNIQRKTNFTWINSDEIEIFYPETGLSRRFKALTKNRV